jgi:hypothetical protein
MMRFWRSLPIGRGTLEAVRGDTRRLLTHGTARIISPRLHLSSAGDYSPILHLPTDSAVRGSGHCWSAREIGASAVGDRLSSRSNAWFSRLPETARVRVIPHHRGGERRGHHSSHQHHDRARRVREVKRDRHWVWRSALVGNNWHLPQVLS